MIKVTRLYSIRVAYELLKFILIRLIESLFVCLFVLFYSQQGSKTTMVCLVDPLLVFVSLPVEVPRYH